MYKQESKIQFVYDAVYALAHALDRLIEDKCGRHVISEDNKLRVQCIETLRIDGEQLYKQYLLNVSFDGSTVYHRISSFPLYPFFNIPP